MKVSIVIPVYNNLEGLRRALNSIVCQSYNDYEIIVTDDSTNNEIENYIANINNTKIQYTKNAVALGSPENWNEGIRKATGEYIKILHHDDWFSSNGALEKFIKIMEQNSDSIFGYSKSVDVFIYKNKKKHRHAEKYIKKLEKDPLLLTKNNRIGAPSVCIFKNGFDIYFDTNLKWLVDIDFYIRILQINPHIAFINEELINIGIQGYRMTNYCLDNKELISFEETYVNNKFSKNIRKVY